MERKLHAHSKHAQKHGTLRCYGNPRLCFGLGLTAPAYADTASDLAAARTKLEQIGTQTQQIHEELSAQTQELDQTAGEITQKQQEIAEGQAKLSSYVAGEYKTGGLSLLQVLTGVDDLGDMLNRLFYYGKVSDKQAQTIQESRTLSSSSPISRPSRRRTSPRRRRRSTNSMPSRLRPRVS